MGSLRRRIVTVVALAGLWTAGVVTFNARAWDSSPLNPVYITKPAPTADRPFGYNCGPRDNAEYLDIDSKGHRTPRKWIQGDVSKTDQTSGRAKLGYNCGLELVGYTPLDGSKSVDHYQRQNANANMAWAGHCAYVSGASGSNPLTPGFLATPPPGGGVAVVDVHDPAKPRHVATLRDPGALATSETIGAVTTPSGRSILVVGQYGNNVVVLPPGQPMDIYDVSNDDCTKFVHMGTYYWPKNIHNLTLSHDGRFVFATIPAQVLDISPLWQTPKGQPKYIADIEDYVYGPPLSPGPLADFDGGAPLPTHPVNTSHEAWLSQDDRTLYLGAQTSETEVFTIMDVGNWLYRADHPAPTVTSQWAGRGHSIRTATINSVPYVLHSEESPFGTGYSCVPKEANPFVGPAQPWLTDISNPKHPKYVTEMGLEINQVENCPEQLNAKEDNSVHYHDVDDPNHTTFVMASMWNSGIRIFDVRHPDKPTEVAYFNPGDIDPTPGRTTLDHTWGHIHYDAPTGNIWFASASGGFWVVHVEGQIRADLGLDQGNQAIGLPPLQRSANDLGGPGTQGVHFSKPPFGFVDITAYYCTLGSSTSANKPVGSG